MKTSISVHGVALPPIGTSTNVATMPGGGDYGP
jgi:hypothetical protein